MLRAPTRDADAESPRVCPRCCGGSSGSLGWRCGKRIRAAIRRSRRAAAWWGGQSWRRRSSRWRRRRDRWPSNGSGAAAHDGWIRHRHPGAQHQPVLVRRRPRALNEVDRSYVDSLVFTPEALRHLVAVVGVDHIMIGTDYPFPWVDAPVDHILKTAGLSDGDRIAMAGGTAARLLGISQT